MTHVSTQRLRLKGGEVGGMEERVARTSGQIGGHDRCGAEWEHTPRQGMLLLHEPEWYLEAQRSPEITAPVYSQWVNSIKEQQNS